MPVQEERYTNGLRFNIGYTMLIGDATLTPPSYSGWPTTGQIVIVAQDNGEIILVTDLSVHPWPVSRGSEGTTAASHVSGTMFVQQQTAGSLQRLIAAFQAGSLQAIGREINFVSGATVAFVAGQIQVAITAMTNPMTTKGDVIVAAAAGVPARLPVGADGKVLTANSGATDGVDWETPSSGFADPTTTKGDLIVHGATTTRLGVGADGDVLVADSTQTDGIKWAPGGGTGTVTSVAVTVPADESVSGSPVTGAGTIAISRNNQSANTIMAGPASGGAATPAFRAVVPADLPVVQPSGSGHAAGIAPDPGSSTGTSRYLREDATWAVPPGTGGGGGGMTNPMTTTGDTIYSSDNTGTPARLAIGATGKVAMVAGGLPVWADVTSAPLRWEPICDITGLCFVDVSGNPLMAVVASP